MRIIVFQGQSQYDVLRDLSRLTAEGFREWGHEVFLCDMKIWNNTDYLDLVRDFKPDFTIGNNPVCYFYNDRLHYEVTGVPHLVRIGDSPYYHIKDRSLRDPDHPLVHSLVSETTFHQQMDEIGVSNYTRVKSFCASNVFGESPQSYRPYPIVFFGSISSPDEIIDSVRKNFTGQLQKLILEFMTIIPEWMDDNQIFLPQPINQVFANFINMEKLIAPETRVDFIKKVYPFIDRYYRNYTRSRALERFAQSGLPMFVFGNDYTRAMLGKYQNVRVLPPVPYRECLEIYAKSKFVLNITPMFFYAHERVSQSMMNGAVLCSSLMPDLIEEVPELLEAAVFYTWGNIGEVTEVVGQLLNNESQRLELAERGQQLAKQYFTPRAYTGEVLNTYHNIFKAKESW